MKVPCPFFLLCVSLGAQPHAVPPEEKPSPKSETLRYNINWPSGLSLGEGQLTSTRLPPGEGGGWRFTLHLEASVPGFPVEEDVRSKATADFCSVELEKEHLRGKRKTKEQTRFDQQKLTATRKTLEAGGTSEASLSPCAKDALAFLFFLRRELVQGRLSPRQKVYYGAAYDTRVEFTGTQTVRLAESAVEADRLVATFKGPASEAAIELFFARDAVRTPVMIRVPLAMGKFTMELSN